MRDKQKFGGRNAGKTLAIQKEIAKLPPGSKVLILRGNVQNNTPYGGCP